MAYALARKEKRLNGLNLEDLHNTIHLVQEDPEMGEAHFRVTNKWKGQALNFTKVGKFFCAGEEQTHKRKFVIHNDEAYALLGEDNSANPVEFLLHALAGCITTTTVYHAAANGINIKKLETTLEGDIDLQGFLQTDPTVPSGITDIRVDMKLESDATGEQREELKNYWRYSPIYDTLVSGANVEVTVNG